jgi:putative FmdB family regulatory protein
MPLFDIVCPSCGQQSEVLVISPDDALVCPSCGEPNAEKLISATSSLTGTSRQGMPGPGDHGCCGSTPGHAGCAGPGSCCGKA